MGIVGKIFGRLQGSFLNGRKAITIWDNFQLVERAKQIFLIVWRSGAFALISISVLHSSSNPLPVGFDQLRIEGLLCDVTLVPGDGDEVFPVHRAMMASASDYFKAMFTGGMKEQDLMCIKLHGVNKIGLKKIIDFIYTAKLSLNMDNLQDTLEAASFLQILPVLDFCKVFLISGVFVQFVSFCCCRCLKSQGVDSLNDSLYKPVKRLLKLKQV
ncbi:Kelch-like protein 13 [Varanus komodoensis]|nr:Kelch-like protein 13 [Varanus komodoensis]